MRTAIFILALSIQDFAYIHSGKKRSNEGAGVYLALFVMFLMMDIAELSK